MNSVGRPVATWYTFRLFNQSIKKRIPCPAPLQSPPSICRQAHCAVRSTGESPLFRRHPSTAGTGPCIHHVTSLSPRSSTRVASRLLLRFESRNQDWMDRNYSKNLMIGHERSFSTSRKHDEDSPVESNKSDTNETDNAVSQTTTSSSSSPSAPSNQKEKETETETEIQNHTETTTEEISIKHAIHFPWRHTPQIPPRILDQNDLSGMPNNTRARFLRKIIAARELNKSFWEVVPIPFYRHEWEVELAENFRMAWEFALVELLMALFPGVPVKNEDGIISIDTSIKMEQTNNTTNENEQEIVAISNTNPIMNDTFLKSMMDKQLLQKYESLADGNNNTTHNLQLKLVIRPVEATLQHIFAVPMLTRDIVEKHPHLKGGYQRIEACFQESGSYQQVRDMTMEIANSIGPSFQRTVIAEAVIQCREFFQVVDLRDGSVVQGMQNDDTSSGSSGCEEEEEEVYHVVRFEVVTDKSDSGEGREVGSWKIIDLDDMLDGNVFH